MTELAAARARWCGSCSIVPYAPAPPAWQCTRLPATVFVWPWLTSKHHYWCPTECAKELGWSSRQLSTPALSRLTSVPALWWDMLLRELLQQVLLAAVYSVFCFPSTRLWYFRSIVLHRSIVGSVLLTFPQVRSNPMKFCFIDFCHQPYLAAWQIGLLCSFPKASSDSVSSLLHLPLSLYLLDPPCKGKQALDYSPAAELFLIWCLWWCLRNLCSDYQSLLSFSISLLAVRCTREWVFWADSWGRLLSCLYS